jgi:hypothetical protein
MPDEQWYALESGQQRGPFTRAQLVARLGDGAPIALVWREGMTGWAPPRDVPEIGVSPAAPAPRSFVEPFRAIAWSYGAPVVVEDDTHHFDTTQADLTVRVTCSDVDDPDDATLEVGRLGVPYPELTIRPEGDLDRAGKRLGIDREVQTHEDALDRAVYFETALPAPVVRDIVGRPGFRRALDRWLERRAHSVRLDEEGLAVALPLARPEALTRALVEAELAAVAEAADALRGLDPALARYRQATWPGWLCLFGILGALVGLPGAVIAVALWDTVSGAPFLIGAGGGVALCVATVAAMLLLLRGQSGSFRTIVYVGVTLLVALPSLGVAGLFTANGALDRSADVVHETVVRRKSEARQRRTASYFFGRARYRTQYYLVTVEGTRRRRIPVSHETWSSTRVGAPFRVRLRPGALGWEWNARPDDGK